MTKDSKPTGGPAYPQSITFNVNGDACLPADYGASLAGMTLRDYFAGQAMQAWLVQRGEVGAIVKIAGGQHNLDLVTVIMAKRAYAMADAMLAERAK